MNMRVSGDGYKAPTVEAIGHVNGRSIEVEKCGLLLEDLDHHKVMLTMRKVDDLKCVIFTHFMPGRRSVFVPGDSKRLEEEWCLRFKAYAACPSVAKVFVFISEGYRALLSIRSPEMTTPFIGLEADRELVAIIRSAARLAGCPEGFIVPIGFDSMVDVLSRLERRAKEFNRTIRLLLLGSGKHMRYDSPKMIDAILRIAGRRTGCPVFRIDDDVRPEEASLRRLLLAYASMPDLHPDAIFVFSGGYGGWDFEKENEQQQALRNNYAVRTGHLADEDNRLDPDRCGRFLRRLSSVGAEQAFSPTRDGGNRENAQVISGAGFCLSSAAVEKLPPFANLDNPITWIDDHLKRKMHEALGDLRENGKVSRVLDALFQQDREDGVERAPAYLPTLARGCIFDALICAKGKSGPYTQAIKSYLEGRFDFPRIFEQGRERDGRRSPTRSLTEWGVELVQAGNQRAMMLAEQWRETLSQRKFVLEGVEFIPNRTIPDVHLQPLEIDGRRMVRCGSPSLVFEVLEDAEQYLELLRVWHSFVDLLKSITDGKDWLFEPSRGSRGGRRQGVAAPALPAARTRKDPAARVAQGANVPARGARSSTATGASRRGGSPHPPPTARSDRGASPSRGAPARRGGGKKGARGTATR